MREIQGNIWDYHGKGYWTVITTNGVVRKDGACVMGRGVAKQAAVRFPFFPYAVGKRIKEAGNYVHMFPSFKLISFPVKHNWWEKADIALIEKSCKNLADRADIYVTLSEVYMVRPGCGNGQLDWKDVKPILEKYLNDRFVVVQV